MMESEMKGSSDTVMISVVCAVSTHSQKLETVQREYSGVLQELGQSYEIIYVIDGPWTGTEEALAEISSEDERVMVYQLAKGFGEATALQYGFERSTGKRIFTIPDSPQIDSGTFLKVLEKLDGGAEVVVTRREPRTDAWLNRMQNKVFHKIISAVVGQNYQDMTCGLRGFSREAALALDLYGDQHRFIPIIAGRVGYKAVEIAGAQHPENVGLRVRGPGVYVRRLLDILNIYFLIKFTRKPLRFFGLLGGGIAGAGLILCTVLGFLRLYDGISLADRPSLILGVLLIVLGIQLASIGLLGEIIIFLSSRRQTPLATEYTAKSENVK